MALSRVKKALLTMVEQAPTQRDRLILLLLHQTGARVSEILGLTAGGYRKAKNACCALVTNKGSQGREEKTIYFTPEIERALIRYICTERARHDPAGQKRLERLADHEPIFLTRRGTPYTRSSLYYHWNKWLVAIPPDEYTGTLGPVLFTPHDIRHLYVSWILRQMKQRYASNPEKLATLRWALQLRMAWRSPLTIMCYDQTESERGKLEQFDAFLQEIEHQAEEQCEPPSVLLSSSAQPSLASVETVQTESLSPPQPPHGMQCDLVPAVHRDLNDLTFWEDGS